jgi:hypothetical protein
MVARWSREDHDVGDATRSSFTRLPQPPASISDLDPHTTTMMLECRIIVKALY